MADTSQDNNKHVEQDSIPLTSEFSPEFDDVSEEATSSKRQEKLQKLRSWWSKKGPTACINFPNLSDSSDSDDDFDDDVDDVIFARARCRVMRVVGKLTTIQQNVQMIYRARYGSTDQDSTCTANLGDLQRTEESLDDISWGQLMLLNSVDILQAKISMVRRLFLAYKMNMSNCKSDVTQETSQEDEVPLISTQIEKRDDEEDFIGSHFASRRHRIVELFSSHHRLIRKFSDLFCYFIKPNTLHKKQIGACKRNVLLDDAFGKIRVAGLQDSLKDDSWNVLDVCHLPSSSVISRCINFSTFLTMISQDDPSLIRSVTSQCDVAQSPSSLISQYQEILIYFRNTALFCAYIFRRLKILEQELCVAGKHLGEMRDKRLKNCKPVSDGDELLRRVMMKSEAVLEMNEIAQTSASPEECRAKRFMIKGILRIEKRAENLMYRFAGWRRSREFPSPKRTNNYYLDGMTKTKLEPMESRVFYKTTVNGLIIKRFCIAKDSLIRKAFSQSTVAGLNDALLVASEPHLNSTSRQMRSMRFKGNLFF